MPNCEHWTWICALANFIWLLLKNLPLKMPFNILKHVTKKYIRKTNQKHFTSKKCSRPSCFSYQCRRFVMYDVYPLNLTLLALHMNQCNLQRHLLITLPGITNYFEYYCMHECARWLRTCWSLTMIVVTTTVRFSMPEVSFGSSGESWISTSLSASFQ